MEYPYIFCTVILITLVIAVVVARRNAIADRITLGHAQEAYQHALDELKAFPADPDRRRLALEAGRHYANLSRDQKGATVFDEVALKNDLDAATAGAGQTRTAPTTQVPVADRLRQLDDLHQQGLITDDEYQARRAKIIEGV